MNTRLLRKVAKHIAEEPRRFQMGTWYQSASMQDQVVEYSTKSSANTHDFPQCGTAACIGGWACILSGVTRKSVLDDAEAKAKKLLNLDSDSAFSLFSVRAWPSRFRDRYLSAKNPAARVRVAVARIEHFIKTKGAE